MKSSKPLTEISQHLLPTQVVGIGASAGGLESLEQLFANLRIDTGAAFVIVQHLSPDYRSMMGELLSRHNEMPITVVEHGTTVLADHIYLLPPGKEMVISDGQLLLSEKERSHSLTLPIDKFFRSLAEDRGKQAVAIVLSGTGSDGSRGLCDVKRAGGTVIVEAPESAKFDGMPISAIATKMVDHVVTAKDIPIVLAGGSAPELPAPSTPEDESPIEAILRLLRAHSSIDFSFYKTSTVNRRIERRVALKHTASIDEYADRLANDPDELNELYHDLLIGVTRFFRDPECFELLEKRVVPELMERTAPDEELRVWVAGCATGEEAYSIAMILFEAFTAARRPLNLKILATDVHRASLEKASRGLYGEEQLVHVNERRRERFFSRRGNGYQVSQDLRQLIVFAPHNVTKDAPFTKMHLITCRNLLIYLEGPAQDTVLSLFHFGLALHGILFLGSSESPGAIANEFVTIDEHCKFYRKRRDVRLLEPRRLTVTGTPLASRGVVPASARLQSDSRLLSIYDRLLDRCMPAGFLLDEDRQLLDTFAGAERWLRVNKRRPSTDVLDLLTGDLRTIVAGAIQQVQKSSGSVRFAEIALPDEDGTLRRYVLHVEPVPNSRVGTTPLLVTLVPTPEDQQAKPTETTQAAELDVRSASNERLATLEGELSYARETLQATVEELQTSNEQLQATNEELVASNEELQSTNEELHSVNEELYTVNAEHQKKIEELRELNSDMQHLLEGTDIGTLFLDSDLKIRKYTPKIAGVFHIQPHDIGRSIGDFSHNLKRASLLGEIQQTRCQGSVVEDEVKDTDGGTFFLRILPYRPLKESENGATREAGTSDVSIGGVVLTLTDIAALDRARARLAQLSAIVESSDDAIVGTDLNGIITSWNRGAERLYGYRASEAIDRHIKLLAPEGEQANAASLVRAAATGESMEHVEARHRNKRGQELDVSLTVSPILAQDGSIVGTSAISRDISPLKNAQRQLLEHGNRVQLLLNSTAEAIFGVDLAGVCTFCNPACARLLGYGSTDELIGTQMHSTIQPVKGNGTPYAQEDGPIYKVLSTGKYTHSEEDLLTRADGTRFQAEYFSHPIRENDRIVGAVVTFLDITDRKQAELEIRKASELREQFLAMLSHELRNPLSAVLNATTVMQSKRASPKAVAKARGVIDRQAKHMACLLEDLLDVSRITRGGIQLRHEPVDLQSAIEMSVEALTPFLNEHATNLTLDLSPQSLVVDGDPARLQQVIVNLLSNAARYSPPGTTVVVSTREVATEVLIKVQDQGSGISPNMLPHIFDLFVQHGQGLDRAKGGLGVGLTLVRKIAELHGGRVEAHSNGIGHGSVFNVWLPRSQQPQCKAQLDPQAASHPPRRILVVEDQDDAREMLRLLLEARGNHVFEAADGPTALKLIERERPEVALIDIGLPTMNGYEIARSVRSDSRARKIRLVALTGYGTSQDIQAARDAGFDNHLTKPADTDSIERILESL